MTEPEKMTETLLVVHYDERMAVSLLLLIWKSFAGSATGFIPVPLVNQYLSVGSNRPGINQGQCFCLLMAGLSANGAIYPHVSAF